MSVVVEYTSILDFIGFNSYSLMVILLIGVPLVVLPIHILGRRIRKVYKKSFARIAEVFSRMHEVFTGIRVVKAYNTEAYEIQRFELVNRLYLRQVIRALRLQSPRNISPILRFCRF